MLKLMLPIFFTVFFQPIALAQGSAGGQGVLKPIMGESCFESASKTITEVCGVISIQWKLWTLVGEPIGDYILKWQLTTVKIKNDSDGVTTFSIGKLPKALSESAKKTELYIDGIAYIKYKKPIHGTIALPFNTGVAVRPTSRASLNVPSGYDWNKLIINGGGFDSKGPAAGGMSTWCVAKGRQYLTADKAKEVFSQGIGLEGMQICPSTFVSVMSIEEELRNICRQTGSAQYNFCGKSQLSDLEARIESEMGLRKDAAAVVDGKVASSASGKTAAEIALEEADREVVAKNKQALEAEKTKSNSGGYMERFPTLTRSKN